MNNTMKIISILMCLYGLVFILSASVYIYEYWDGTRIVPCQLYYMDSVDFNHFKAEYEYICNDSNVSKSYCSPYHDNYEKVDFIEQIKEKGMYCNFYSDVSKSLMKFYVYRETPLRISFYSITNSCETKKEPLSANSHNINDGSDWPENYRQMKVFEDTILKRIGSYRKDLMQGFICWYGNFFGNKFFWFIMVGVVLKSVQFYIWKSKK